MALGVTERLKIIFDVETQTFKQGIRTLKADMAAADGFVAKTKVGAKGLFDQLGQYGPQAALAAGGALVAFGAKAVMSYKDAALEAGKFAEATGMSVEDASRLAEVAADVGVEMGTLESAARKVNAAASTGALSDYGVEIAKTKDGAYDATQTFLNTVEAIGQISNAADREVAAKKLMGKSWAELAELTTMSADEMRQAMDNVAAGQVFTDEDYQQAKDLRDGFDQLQDTITELSNELARKLAPAVVDATEAIGDTIDVVDTLSENKLVGWLGKVNDGIKKALGFGDIGQKISEVDDAINGSELDGLAASLTRVAEESGTATSGTEDLTEATEDAAPPTAEYTSKIEALATALDDARKAEEDAAGQRRALADLNREVAAETDAYQDALVDLAGATMDQTTSAADLEDKTRATADAAISLAKAQAEQKAASGDARDENALLIEALSETASTLAPGSPLRAELDAYIATLRAVPSSITTTVNLTGEGVGVVVGGNDFRRAPAPTGFGSGPVARMANTRLFQQGIDARQAQRDSISGIRPMDRPNGSGMTIYVNVPNAIVADGKAIKGALEQVAPQIDAAITKWKRGQG